MSLTPVTQLKLGTAFRGKKKKRGTQNNFLFKWKFSVFLFWNSVFRLHLTTVILGKRSKQRIFHFRSGQFFTWLLSIPTPIQITDFPLISPVIMTWFYANALLCCTFIHHSSLTAFPSNKPLFNSWREHKQLAQAVKFSNTWNVFQHPILI